MEHFHISDKCPPEVARDFARYVERYECSVPVRMWDELDKRGWAPPAGRDLSDEQLSVALRRLVVDLSTLNYYIVCTEHLDDRDLYEELVRALREDEVVFWPDDPYSSITHDMTECGDIDAWLRYYASPAARAYWAVQYPDEPLPQAELPPYPRDWIPERPNTPEDLAPSLFLEEGK